MRPLSAFLACTFILAASAACADSRVFIIANEADGYGVDQCLAKGDKCGAHAARSYCQSRDFAGVFSFCTLGRFWPEKRYCSSMALVRILVDGYSLLHQWPDLAPGKPRHSAVAREELINRLTQYYDATGTPITIIFDGASGPAVEFPSTPEVEILYSRAGQTADQIIERVTHLDVGSGDQRASLRHGQHRGAKLVAAGEPAAVQILQRRHMLLLQRQITLVGRKLGLRRFQRDLLQGIVQLEQRLPLLDHIPQLAMHRRDRGGQQAAPDRDDLAAGDGRLTAEDLIDNALRDRLDHHRLGRANRCGDLRTGLAHVGESPAAPVNTHSGDQHQSQCQSSPFATSAAGNHLETLPVIATYPKRCLYHNSNSNGPTIAISVAMTFTLYQASRSPRVACSTPRNNEKGMRMRSIENGSEPETSGRDNLRTLQVVFAEYRSMAEKRAVRPEEISA